MINYIHIIYFKFFHRKIHMNMEEKTKIKVNFITMNMNEMKCYQVSVYVSDKNMLHHGIAPI